MVDFHLEVKLATFLFMSNCKCLICDPSLSQASCRKWFSFPLCPPPLPISFSFSLFLSSPLFPSLHRGKIRVNTGQDTPVCVSILTECKMEGGGEGGREEGYRKFTVDYSTFPGIVSEVVLLSALMCDVKAIAHVLKRCIKPCA